MENRILLQRSSLEPRHGLSVCDHAQTKIDDDNIEQAEIFRTVFNINGLPALKAKDRKREMYNCAILWAIPGMNLRRCCSNKPLCCLPASDIVERKPIHYPSRGTNEVR